MEQGPQFIEHTSPPPGPAVRILLLEDDPMSVEIVGTYLQRTPFADVDVQVAETLAGALALLAQDDVELVVADLHLPDSAGASTIQSLVQATGSPVIAITGDRDPGMRDATLACGAFEFLPKRDLTEATLMRLVRLATMQARTYRSLRESRIAEAALRESEGRFRNLARFGQSAVVRAEPAELVQKAARAIFDALAAERRGLRGARPRHRPARGAHGVRARRCRRAAGADRRGQRRGAAARLGVGPGAADRRRRAAVFLGARAAARRARAGARGR